MLSFVSFSLFAVSIANHLRAVADAFCPLRTHQRYGTTDCVYIFMYIDLVYIFGFHQKQCGSD